MANFISKGGKWYPTKERAVNAETGEIYEGKDREAMNIIRKQTGSPDNYIGMPVEEDPENIMRARQLGMTVKEFLKMNTPPTPEQAKLEASKDNIVVTHRKAPPKRGVKSGSGGFGETPV